MRKISLMFLSILLVGCSAAEPDAVPVAAPSFNDTLPITGIPLVSTKTPGPIVKPTPSYTVSKTIKPTPKPSISPKPTKTKTTRIETPEPSPTPTPTKTKTKTPKPVETTTEAKPEPTKTVTPSKTPTPTKATTTATPSPRPTVTKTTTKSLPSPTKTATVASSTTVWDKIAQCESGGNWSINTGNGFYGGLQFTLSSWRAMGGTGYPHQASKSEQIMRAEKLQDAQGWGAWPVCSIKAGVR